jgi:hypothetical protein
MVALGQRQGFRRSLFQQRLYGPPLCLDLIQAKIGCSRAGDYDEIHAVRQKTRPGAKAFPAESLHAVSSHGRADCTRNNEAEPGRMGGRALACDEQREMRRPNSSSRLLCLHELRMFAQSSPLGELEGQNAVTSCKSRAPSAGDPFGDGSEAPCDPLVSTSARESHGFAPGECCAAGRYAS